MKKFTLLLIASVLMLSALSIYSFAANPSDELISPLSNCNGEHDYEFLYRNSANTHTLKCKNCIAILTEPCYVDVDCWNHWSKETLPCEVCELQTDIHNFEPMHTSFCSNNHHINTCVNEDWAHVICGSMAGQEEEKCDIEHMQIWRGWKPGEGHYRTGYCVVCEYTYDRTPYYPAGHPDGFDPLCKYCSMDDPYHMDFPYNNPGAYT